MGKYPILYAEFMNKRTYFKQLCAKNRHLKKLRAEPFLEAELINSQPNLVKGAIKMKDLLWPTSLNQRHFITQKWAGTPCMVRTTPLTRRQSTLAPVISTCSWPKSQTVPVFIPCALADPLTVTPRMVASSLTRTAAMAVSVSSSAN